jgi:hypothetical protein
MVISIYSQPKKLKIKNPQDIYFYLNSAHYQLVIVIQEHVKPIGILGASLCLH